MLLTGIDRVAHAADFDVLLFDGRRDQEHGPAGNAGRFGILMHRWVDGGFHNWEILKVFWQIAIGPRPQSCRAEVRFLRSQRLNSQKISWGGITEPRSITRFLSLPLRVLLEDL